MSAHDFLVETVTDELGALYIFPSARQLADQRRAVEDNKNLKPADKKKLLESYENIIAELRKRYEGKIVSTSYQLKPYTAGDAIDAKRASKEWVTNNITGDQVPHYDQDVYNWELLQISSGLDDKELRAMHPDLTNHLQNELWARMRLTPERITFTAG